MLCRRTNVVLKLLFRGYHPRDALLVHKNGLQKNPHGKNLHDTSQRPNLQPLNLCLARASTCLTLRQLSIVRSDDPSRDVDLPSKRAACATNTPPKRCFCVTQGLRGLDSVLQINSGLQPHLQGGLGGRSRVSNNEALAGGRVVEDEICDVHTTERQCSLRRRPKGRRQTKNKGKRS
ncbi:hypothetical protein P154DRAFT_292155 [Amniculicola lignicola CBS 123094]|uniref:Uncharacterized protein n=1 Tax=Amniculicola lignicola CBS 123094 TaxID=1392246 RepID=A0A6A5WZ69_9PLEO|nr:hypothetical protein P154DRAFT_292155 [Amniculicola lignicola CBS 123094]